MALVIQRRLALPLWTMAFFAVALAASLPTTLLLIILGTVLMAFTMSRLAPRVRSSPAVVPIPSTGKWAATIVVGGCVRTADEQSRRTPEDALDLVRTDEDGSWQMEGKCTAASATTPRIVKDDRQRQPPTPSLPARNAVTVQD